MLYPHISLILTGSYILTYSRGAQPTQRTVRSLSTVRMHITISDHKHESRIGAAWDQDGIRTGSRYACSSPSVCMTMKYTSIRCSPMHPTLTHTPQYTHTHTHTQVGPNKHAPALIHAVELQQLLDQHIEAPQGCHPWRSAGVGQATGEEPTPGSMATETSIAASTYGTSGKARNSGKVRRRRGIKERLKHACRHTHTSVSAEIEQRRKTSSLPTFLLS